MVWQWFGNGSTMVRQELTNRSSPTEAHQPELTNRSLPGMAKQPCKKREVYPTFFMKLV